VSDNEKRVRHTNSALYNILSPGFIGSWKCVSWRIDSFAHLYERAFWNTYYCRIQIKSIGCTREYEFSEVRELILRLEAAGVNIGLDAKE
jgi:hypothetical protein